MNEKSCFEYEVMGNAEIVTKLFCLITLSITTKTTFIINTTIIITKILLIL